MSTSCDAYKSSPVNWELSLYDLHRTPQPLIEDDTEIAILPSTLNSELKCPICLDLLRNTMTTKECLHRFCQECIITALRAGNKECPTCRKKLVSKRSLRRDPNFDELISKIFPCREEYEAAQDDKWTKISSKTLANVSGTVNASFQKRRSSGIASRYSIRKSAKVNKGEDEDKKLCTDATTYPVGAGDVVMNSTPLSQGSEEVEQQQQIQMIFKPLNATTTEVLTSVQRYLKTTPNALIEHLSMFIAMRMRIESQEEEQPSSTNVRNDHQQAEDALKDVLQRTSKQSENTSAYRIYVYCSKENTQVLLDPSQLLGSVYAQYNVNQEPLQMFYAAVGSDESKMSLPSPTTHLQHHGKDKKKR